MFFNKYLGKLIDGLLNGKIFTTLLETKMLVEDWKNEYNQFRPYNFLNHQPSATKTVKLKVEIHKLGSGTSSMGRSKAYTGVSIPIVLDSF